MLKMLNSKLLLAEKNKVLIVTIYHSFIWHKRVTGYYESLQKSCFLSKIN